MYKQTVADINGPVEGNYMSDSNQINRTSNKKSTILHKIYSKERTTYSTASTLVADHCCLDCIKLCWYL